MNMKNITKTGLNNFIDRKVSNNKADAKQEIKELIENKLNPVLDAHIDCKEVEKLASKYVDEMQNTLDKYSEILEKWQYKQLIQHANSYAVNVGQKARDEVKRRAWNIIGDNYEGSFDFGIAEINEVVEELRIKCQPIYKRIQDYEKLQYELEQVIKIEHNGGRAYKALVALGVDMEGYSEGASNLPAIVKLSVDVCLLNGDCDKKETA